MRRILRTRAILVALACLAALCAAPVSAQERHVLYIQPLGKQLPDTDVELVKTALVSFYGLDVQLLPRVDLPKGAWYPPRKRYRADILLDFLETRLPADGIRVLGLTGVDISTTKGDVYDWGILGLATMEGAACVISSFRARRGVGAKAGRDRLAKVAVHEIGHTLGLPHCPTVGCLMEDAKGTVSTTDREYDLCSRCRAALLASGRKIPAAPEIPWPRPQAPESSASKPR